MSKIVTFVAVLLLFDIGNGIVKCEASASFGGETMASTSFASNSIPANNNVIISSSSSVPDVAAARAIYSPLVDYNNVWTPIGHGDPLKKDPTYDYSPPVLDRVRYWAADTSASDAPQTPVTTYHRYAHQHLQSAATVDSNTFYNPHRDVVHKTKSDILLLGVPASMKQQQRGAGHVHHKAIAVGGGISQQMHHQQHHQQQKQQQQPARMKYYAQLPTVLMPPPMQTLANQVHTNQQHNQQYSHQPIKSNSPTYSDWPQTPSPATDSITQESTGHYVSVAVPENLPTSPNSLVTYATNRHKPWIQAMLQKEVDTTKKSTPTATATMQPATSAVSMSHPQMTSAMPATVSMMTMSPSSPAVFESHQHSLMTNSMPMAVTPQTSSSQAQPSMMTTYQQHSTKNNAPMWTQPPPVMQLSNHIFDKFVASAASVAVYRPNAYTTTSSSWETATHFTPTVRPYMMPTTTTTAEQHTSTGRTTSTMMSPNGDDMFSHYRQPQPHRGPAYMISEGHSKVRNYGNSLAGRREPNVRPVESISDPVVERIEELPQAKQRPSFVHGNEIDGGDDGGRYDVRHLHYKQEPSPEQREDERMSAGTSTTTPTTTTVGLNGQTKTPPRMAGLLSLLDTSFGDFFTGTGMDEEATNGPTLFATTTTKTTAPMTTVATTTNDVDEMIATTTTTEKAIDADADAKVDRNNNVGHSTVSTTTEIIAGEESTTLSDA